jgi:acetyl esterase/lipase
MKMTVAYNPANRFEIKSWDTEFRRAPKRTLMARIYQPQGDGPFPVLLDLHGGAWNNQDRTANVAMDEALAKSGILVVAIDLTRAPEAPYPSSIQDANYGVRWLKHKAREWDGDASTSARSAARAAATKSSSAPCGRMSLITRCISWRRRRSSMRR